MRGLIFLIAIFVCLAACRSGGNGGGAAGHTHNQLAERFVRELNLDPDFNVTLVKRSTLQRDYIVIYDPYTNTYDAIDIRSYDPRYDNAALYYFDSAYRHFYGLYQIPAHYERYWEIDEWGNSYIEQVYIPTRYHDPYSSVVFEKTEGRPKDLAKVVAIAQVAEIEKTAKYLSSHLGLSLNRAKEVARLKAKWKKASLKSMTNQELDHFAIELLGFSISNAKKAIQKSLTGNSSPLEELIDVAAQTNSITPEHVSKLMAMIFGL